MDPGTIFFIFLTIAALIFVVGYFLLEFYRLGAEPEEPTEEAEVESEETGEEKAVETEKERSSA